MFSVFAAIAAAWGEIAHISEITGVSVGVLAALIALAVFDPLARRLAIELAVFVVLAYSGTIAVYHLGASDVRAQWAAADKRAAEERKATDAAIAAKLTADNPAPATTEIDDNARKVLGELAGDAGAACQLGADALRLRNK